MSKLKVDSLASLGDLSVEELREQLGDMVDIDEARQLHDQVRRARNRTLLDEKNIIIRHSPLVPKRLQHVNDRPIERPGRYCAPGDVASMFSPAAYLAELYKQAKELYPAKNPWHIDERRPDLRQLVLSQNNLDTPISALSLSNEILLSRAIEALTPPGSPALNHDQLLETLSTDVGNSTTPYHHHHNRLRQVFVQNDADLSHLLAAPHFTKHLDDAALACLHYDISPALRRLLTDDINEQNAEPVTLGEAVKVLLDGKTVEVDDQLEHSSLALAANGMLSVQFGLKALNLAAGFETAASRRIRSIAVSLPALLGPYQDVHARLLTSAQKNKGGGNSSGAQGTSVASGAGDAANDPVASTSASAGASRDGAGLLASSSQLEPSAADTQDDDGWSQAPSPKSKQASRSPKKESVAVREAGKTDSPVYEKLKRYLPTDRQSGYGVMAIGQRPKSDGTKQEYFFLERGTVSRGFKHVTTRHRADFADQGITRDKDIADLVMAALAHGKVIGIQNPRPLMGKRPIYEVTFNNEQHFVAVQLSTDGYDKAESVIGANPSEKHYFARNAVARSRKK